MFIFQQTLHFFPSALFVSIEISSASSLLILSIFASDVMPEFKENEEKREKEKMEELAPYLAQAMERKKWMPQFKDEDIPEVEALGRQIIEQEKNKKEKVTG